jgi:hypothetical protein
MKQKKQTTAADVILSAVNLNLCPPTSAGTTGQDGGHYSAGRPVLPYSVPPSLLSVNADSKTIKGTSFGFLTAILYMAPGTLAGVGNVCPHASKGCLSSCLFTAGRAGIFKAINEARINRTRFFFYQRESFLAQLAGEIAAVVRKAEREGMRPVVRLNGTSDLPWEKLAPDLFTQFPTVTFYDYTKNVRRAIAWANGEFPKNYSLTFSLSESNRDHAETAIAAGVNVAVVFDGPTVRNKPLALNNGMDSRPWFSADESDLRFLDRPGKDGRGRFGILKAKGKAKKDENLQIIKSRIVGNH